MTPVPFSTSPALAAEPSSRTAKSAVEAVAIHHAYDDGSIALHQIDLAVHSGEFCTLLGPSGSGKTTLLRIFAGLLGPTGGRVRIAGRDVTDVPVQRRNIGFVFQNYALFPHLSVADNIAFPLKIRGQDRAERARRVAEVVELVSLQGLEHRFPGQLSGGQQQRVAIGRALVFGPEVLLLDEPLGALDRRLRQQLGAELRRIQQETGTTAIYVTHDQEEAFLLSDTVVVMDHGRIRQEGSPVDVYGAPSDRFVATFLGDTNVLDGAATEISPAGVTLDVDGVAVLCAAAATPRPGERAACSLRPEDVEVHASEEAVPPGRCIFGPANVEQCVFLGSRFRLALDARGRQLVAEVARGSTVPDTGSTVTVAWQAGSPVLITDDRRARQS